MRTCSIRTIVQAAAIAMLSVVSAQATTPEALSVPMLKEAYLECERKALVQPISAGEIAWCSDVYEALKIRAFDGDWRRLWMWTRENLAPGNTV